MLRSLTANVRRIACVLALVAVFPALPPVTRGQEGPRRSAGHALAIRETMAQIIARDRQSPRVARSTISRRRKTLRPSLKHSGPDSPLLRSAGVVPEAGVRILPKSPQLPGSSFLGTNVQDDQTDQTGYFIPLDAMGAAGPTQIVLISNIVVKVFDKATGALTAGIPEVSVNVFFGSVINPATSSTDVRARYDRLSQRWFLAALDGDTTTSTGGLGNHFMLAVSDGPTLSSQTTWSFFSFVAGIDDLQADSDTIGIDANAIYIGASLFDDTGTFQSCAAYVIQKSSVLGAGPMQVTTFPGICTIDNVGSYLPQGADNDDPSPTYGYLIGVDVSTLYAAIPALSTNLKLIRIANAASTSPTIDQTFSIPVPPFGFPLGTDRSLLVSPPPNYQPPIGVPVEGCEPAPRGNPFPPRGVVIGLDDLDPRLTVATIRGGNLWTVHNIDVDQTGAAIGYSAAGVPSSASGRDGARWYEITGLGTTPVLAQSGTSYDSTSGSGASSHFVPSLAVTGQGHMALASSRGGPNEYADIVAAGRLSGDPAGATQADTLLKSSTTAYNFDTNDPAQRWGDYTCTCVDPNDNMTVWTFQEYCDGTFSSPDYGVQSSQAVQVIELMAPPPSQPTTASPPSVSTGLASILVTLTAPSAGGSGLYDPGSGFPNHLTAGVSDGITVNAVTYLDPAHVTLDLNTTGAAAGTQASVTLVNPDGQSVTASNLLAVTAPGSAAATVTQVTSSQANGTYGEGAAIPVTVAFSEGVAVTGSPSLSLSSGGTATYTGGSGTATLTFTYGVAAGNSTGGAALDVASTQALVLNGGTITTGGTPATLTLPLGATASPPWSLSSLKTIVINTTPPVTTITSEPSNPSNNTTPVFTYSASQAGCTFEVEIDGGGWSAPGAAASVTIGPPGYAALGAGSHTFQVRAVDPLGNVDPAPPSYTWTIDLTPPVTTLLTTPPNPDTNASPTFTFSANKAGCIFQIKVDTQPWSSVGTSTSATVGPLASGSHTFTVRAIDPAGNVDPSPPSYTWTLNVPPAVAASTGGGGGGGGGGCGALGLEGILLGAAAGRLGRGRRRRRGPSDAAGPPPPAA